MTTGADNVVLVDRPGKVYGHGRIENLDPYHTPAGETQIPGYQHAWVELTSVTENGKQRKLEVGQHVRWARANIQPDFRQGRSYQLLPLPWQHIKVDETQTPESWSVRQRRSDLQVCCGEGEAYLVGMDEVPGEENVEFVFTVEDTSSERLFQMRVRIEQYHNSKRRGYIEVDDNLEDRHGWLREEIERLARGFLDRKSKTRALNMFTVQLGEFSAERMLEYRMIPETLHIPGEEEPSWKRALAITESGNSGITEEFLKKDPEMLTDAICRDHANVYLGYKPFAVDASKIVTVDINGEFARYNFRPLDQAWVQSLMETIANPLNAETPHAAVLAPYFPGKGGKSKGFLGQLNPAIPMSSLRYVPVSGNHSSTAIKNLLKDHQSGKRVLPPAVLQRITKRNAYLINGNASIDEIFNISVYHDNKDSQKHVSWMYEIFRSLRAAWSSVGRPQPFTEGNESLAISEGASSKAGTSKEGKKRAKGHSREYKSVMKCACSALGIDDPQPVMAVLSCPDDDAFSKWVSIMETHVRDALQKKKGAESTKKSAKKPLYPSSTKKISRDDFKVSWMKPLCGCTPEEISCLADGVLEGRITLQPGKKKQGTLDYEATRLKLSRRLLEYFMWYCREKHWVAQGASNAEVVEQMKLTPEIVEYWLSVFEQKFFDVLVTNTSPENIPKFESVDATFRMHYQGTLGLESEALELNRPYRVCTEEGWTQLACSRKPFELVVADFRNREQKSAGTVDLFFNKCKSLAAATNSLRVLLLSDAQDAVLYANLMAPNKYRVRLGCYTETEWLRSINTNVFLVTMKGDELGVEDRGLHFFSSSLDKAAPPALAGLEEEYQEGLFPAITRTAARHIMSSLLEPGCSRWMCEFNCGGVFLKEGMLEKQNVACIVKESAQVALLDNQMRSIMSKTTVKLQEEYAASLPETLLLADEEDVDNEDMDEDQQEAIERVLGVAPKPAAKRQRTSEGSSPIMPKNRRRRAESEEGEETDDESEEERSSVAVPSFTTAASSNKKQKAREEDTVQIKQNNKGNEDKEGEERSAGALPSPPPSFPEADAQPRDETPPPAQEANHVEGTTEGHALTWPLDTQPPFHTVTDLPDIRPAWTCGSSEQEENVMLIAEAASQLTEWALEPRLQAEEQPPSTSEQGPDVDRAVNSPSSPKVLETSTAASPHASGHCPESTSETHVGQRVVLLDLNGILVHRLKDKDDIRHMKQGHFAEPTSRLRNRHKSVMIRPNAGELFSMLKEMRAAVGIWSSAMLHNIQPTLELVYAWCPPAKEVINPKLIFGQACCWSPTQSRGGRRDEAPLLLKDEKRLVTSSDEWGLYLPAGSIVLVDDSPIKNVLNKHIAGIFPRSFNPYDDMDAILPQLIRYLR